MRRVGILLSAVLLLSAPHAGAVNVLTQHNDTARTGANLNETVLTTGNVNSTQFGKLWSYPVTGQVYAQPLHVDNVTIGGVTRNVLYVATMHNNVYAFDAQGASTTPLWSVNLGPSVPMPDSSGLGTSGPCRTYQDLLGEIGILSTPVIDLATNTMYVETKTKEGSSYIDRIHALDITTGAEKMGGPVQITASVSGTAGARTLDSLRANQRSSLLLANGRVYVAFSSYCDSPSYYGWVIGYSASNLGQAPVVYNAVQDGTQAGIWMSGEAPSADSSGNVYVVSGNGSFNGNSGGRNLGNSVIKLSSTLAMLDWFTPYNQSSLNSTDLDLGSSGPMLVPGSSLIVAGGKEGKIYLLNSGSLGHYQSGSDSQIVQSFMSSGTHLHGSPVYWNGPSGALVYVGAESDYIKGYRLTSGMFATSPFTQTGFRSPTNAMPGSILSVSANGGSNGILWANMTISQDANHATVPGLLRAFDASNLSVELWNSQQNSSRDSFGNHAKYCAPTIANGRVYMATFSNQVVVYGLLSAATPTATSRTAPTATTRATPTATSRVTATATATATTGATPTVTPTPAPATNVAQGKPISASSVQQTFVATNANDGSVTTYWEGAANTYPNTLTVSLGTDYAISSVVVKLNPATSWASRTQTFSVLGHPASTTTFSTLVASAAYTFNPSTNANTVTIPVTATVSDVRLSVTANTGASAGQVAEFQVIAAGGGPTPTVTATATARATATPTPRARARATATARSTPVPGNLAQGKPVVASSLEASQYAATNAVDGNTATRWSSAFSDPQWIRVDLGASTSIARVRLNWEAAYGKSYQVQVSNDAVTWSTLFSTTTGDGGIDDITGLAASGRYVRMWGTVRAISAGYSLWEFEVYGP